jgi:glycine oxidase
MDTTPPVDVIVIGCGVVGASVAWRLAQLGMSVSCFDPEPGGGATHAAAGMLGAVGEADFGEDDLTVMNIESARTWPAFAAELEDESGLSTGIRPSGTLTVAFDSGDRQQLDRLLRLRRRLGLSIEEITVADARRMEPLLGPRLSAAAWTPGDHQVDPRRVHTALMTVLQTRHIPVIRRRVIRLQRRPTTGGGIIGVIDEAGEAYGCGSVVLAAGWSSRELVRDIPTVDAPTRPVKGQVVRLDARSQPSFGLGRVVRGFVQARQVYLVPRGDGEIVVGATNEEQPDDRVVTAGGLFSVLRDARALVPGIDELPIAELTARARPGSPDNLPIIGDSGVPGLTLATGHYRNGILLAPLTAAAIAAHYRDGTTLPAVAAATPSRFTGRLTGRSGDRFMAMTQAKSSSKGRT